MVLSRVGTGVARMMGRGACAVLDGAYIHGWGRLRRLCGAQVQGFVPLLVPLVGHCLTSYVGLEEVE